MKNRRLKYYCILRQSAVLFYILLLILLFSNHLAAQEQEKSEKPRPVKLSKIKYLNQNENGGSQWCVVYSTAMLLSRFDISDAPENIAKHLNMETRHHSYFSWKSTFTEEDSVESVIQNKYGLQTQKKIFVTLRNQLTEWIKENLDKDRPILMIYGRIYGHAIVLTGYDESNIYINDPSGAFFSEASREVNKNIVPRIWLDGENKTSRFEGAGVRWEDFSTFMKERNLWGYMITAWKEGPLKEHAP